MTAYSAISFPSSSRHGAPRSYLTALTSHGPAGRVRTANAMIPRSAARRAGRPRLAAISVPVVGRKGAVRYPGYVLHVEETMGQSQTAVPNTMPNLRGLLDCLLLPGACDIPFLWNLATAAPQITGHSWGRSASRWPDACQSVSAKPRETAPPLRLAATVSSCLSTPMLQAATVALYSAYVLGSSRAW
jgi:hypothetical protein